MAISGGAIASGAGLGATLGSAIPGVGTLIGGGVGALGGLLSGLFSGGSGPALTDITKNVGLAPQNQFQATQAPLDEESYRKLIEALQAQAQAGGAQQGMSREQQMGFIQALQQQMAGRGPSLAQSQLTQAADAATKRSAGAIGSTTGINPALQARMIAESGANTQLGLAGESGRLRLQEQLATQGLLNQALASARGADIATQQSALTGVGTAGGLAGAQQGRVLSNFQQTQGLNANVAQQNLQAQQSFEDLNARMAEANAGRSFTQAGGLMSGLGAAASLVPGMFSGGGGGTGGLSGDFSSAAGGSGGFLGSGAGAPNIAHGGMVPGKDSEEYDKVHAMLSPGEIVLPRSVVQKGDAPERARDFVREIQKRAKGGKVAEPNYGPILAKLKRIKMELHALGV